MSLLPSENTPIVATDHDFEPTGIVEYTDLTDVDRAVRSFFGRMIDAMVVTDAERKENREFATFQAKPMKEKLYVGQFESPQEFVNQLAGKHKQRKEALPACYLSRDTAIVYCDGDDYVDMSNFATLVADGSTTPYAVVSKSFAKLTYTMTALTWNKETGSRLALGLSMWLRHTKQGRKHTFKARTMIAGAPVELKIEINQPRLAVGASLAVSMAEERLHGISFDFEVISEVLEAQALDVTTKTFAFNESEVMA